jgi:hypothetical protein
VPGHAFRRAACAGLFKAQGNSRGATHDGNEAAKDRPRHRHRCRRDADRCKSRRDSKHRGDLFGTDKPTEETVLKHLSDVLRPIDRGHCFYVITYRDGKPSSILFAGYSYD